MFSGKGAKKRYEHLLKISPDNSAALNNLAWLLRHDDTDTAFDLVQKALLLSPNAPAYLDTYGMLLLDKGNSAKSVETLRKAAAGAPNNPSITIHLALALSKNGNPNQALGMLEKIRPAEISPRVKQEYEEVAKVLGGSK